MSSKGKAYFICALWQPARCRNTALSHIGTALNEWQCQPASSSMYETRRHNHADMYSQNGNFDNIHRHGQPRSYKTCFFIGSTIVHVPCRISECRVLNECTCTHHIAVPSPLIISKKYISCFRSCYCNTLL